LFIRRLRQLKAEIMYRKYLLLIALFITISVKAHQPDMSTTMLVEKENNTWILQISASLTAFQQEVRTHFSETPYKTPEEFQQMVLEHIKNNLEIIFNNNEVISLNNGFVKLGHETQVIFEVSGVPSNINSVIVKNRAFEDIHKNRSALIFLKEGFKKERFVLNAENNHTLSLQVDVNKFVETVANKPTYFSSKTIIILLIFSLLASGVVFVKKKYDKQKEA
tara:strand:- start:373 stop:1038 length:666 start_codon:yes stop_codon:yes gene_type:complete